MINYTSSFDEVISDLRKLFVSLRKANLQLRVDKCMFGYHEIDFVGLHISANGVSPMSGMIKDIENMPIHNNRKELERFLGMVVYYRQFIKDMSDISEPLNRLRRKGQPYKWDDSCNSAFNKLKGCLTKPPVLAFPDWKKSFLP